MSKLKNKSVFIGNGIHRAFPKDAISWENLLSTLKKSKSLNREFVGLKNVDVTNPLKPFPFVFEELLHTGNAGGSGRERTMLLKKEILKIFSDQVKSGKNTFNKFHTMVMDSSAKNIITCNYDYGFELAGTESFYESKSSKALNRTERTANLKRGYSINKKTIWHMHGELIDCRNPKVETEKDFSEQSILMGFDQYSKNLTDLKKFIDGSNDGNGDIIHKISRKERKSESWCEKFFTDDVDIIGVGLGFEEQDIWWLLNRRAYKRKTNKDRKTQIDNTIRFFHKKVKKESVLNMTPLDLISYYRSAAIKDILKAVDVDVLEVAADDWEDYYEKVISKI